MPEPVLLERDGPVAIVTLNEPGKRNVLDTVLREALHAALDGCIDERRVRAIVLAARGDFCAGGGLDAYDDVSGMGARWRLQESHRILRLLLEGPNPVVAAVEGAAFGAGVGLALACDHIVAGKTGRFSPSSAQLAILPDWGLLFTLPRRIGFAKARELFLFGGVVDAEAAMAMGLVDHLVPEGGARAAAVALARQLAEGPPLALQLTKAALNGLDLSLESVLQAELEGQPHLFQSEDFHEAVAAFNDRRKPVFRGE